MENKQSEYNIETEDKIWFKNNKYTMLDIEHKQKEYKKI